MTNTAFLNTSVRRLLKLALAPAVLTACITLGNSPQAFGYAVAQNSSASCQGTEERENDGCPVVDGSWLYTVSIPDPDRSVAPLVFLGTETYDSGGGYSEADQLSITPGYFATAGHGAWQASGNRYFLLTYVNLTYDNKGTATGSSKVRQTMRLSKDGTQYTGSGDFFYYDLNGSVVDSGTFTITAKRITVHRPA